MGICHSTKHKNENLILINKINNIQNELKYYKLLQYSNFIKRTINNLNLNNLFSNNESNYPLLTYKNQSCINLIEINEIDNISDQCNICKQYNINNVNTISENSNIFDSNSTYRHNDSKIDRNFIDRIDLNFIKQDIYIKNLILAGGSIKCLSYCGSLKKLDEYNLLKNITTFVGSCFGSIFACLLAIGYSSDDILHIIKTTNFKDFIDDDVGHIKDFYNLLNEFGYCNGHYI